jgi:hypothetical protein
MLPMAFEARPRLVPAEELVADIGRPAPAPLAPVPDKDETEVEAIYAEALRAIVADADAAFRSPSTLFQDFQVRCRMAGLSRPPLDLPGFTRRLSCARAGIFDVAAEEWQDALALAGTLPDDMMGAFLLVARAAKEGRPCPSDAELATTYGTSSLGRVRRLIGYIESRELFVTRVDLSGKRSITIPRLGWTTESADAA